VQNSFDGSGHNNYRDMKEFPLSRRFILCNKLPLMQLELKFFSY